jgi:hypothetical protein
MADAAGVAVAGVVVVVAAAAEDISIATFYKHVKR